MVSSVRSPWVCSSHSAVSSAQQRRHDAQQAAPRAYLGPTHRLLVLRRLAEAHFAAGELDAWATFTAAAIDLAAAAGLRDELRALAAQLATLAPTDRWRGEPLRERLHDLTRAQP